ncbi:PerC family transcriptional regulator, partial [Salmonella enterica subsp. enterica serovar Typhimurium]|nr:PerC family transcriptional regulator [Salmonella enterica subsp. enterica serovar Typhimurium]
HRFEGKTRRHFALETDIQPDQEPDIGTKPVRSCYVGTNDPQVIMHLIRQAETLESGGLFRRAATVWMEAFRESHIPSERSAFLARRERCLRKSRKSVASGSEWYLSGNYVGS